MKTKEQLEWEEKYGGKSDREMNEIVKGMISAQAEEIRARAEERHQKELEEERSLTYPKIVKAIPEAQKRIKGLDGKPEKLQEAKKKVLNKEFDNLLKIGMFSESSRALWVSEKLLKWMQTDEEYLQTKADLAQARNDYSRYLALKEDWEKENEDIIKAERIRSKRAELLQADPETLKSLGITPDPAFIGTQAPAIHKEKSAIVDNTVANNPMVEIEYKAGYMAMGVGQRLGYTSTQIAELKQKYMREEMEKAGISEE